MLKPRGRPRLFDEEKALDQAMLVFWDQGFDNASLSDLTAAMGIKPASLYLAFGNKRELFKKALDRYRVQQLSFVQDALKEPTARAVAERLLKSSAVFLTRPGLPRKCLTIQTPTASDDLIVMRKEGQKALRNRFARAKREGDLQQDASPESLSRFITTVCQGMNTQSINGATRRELLDVAEVSMRAWPMGSLATKPGLKTDRPLVASAEPG